MSMKKILAVLLCLIMVFPMLFSCDETTPELPGTEPSSQTETAEPEPGYDPDTTLFVAPDGDDGAADGSFEKPYATLAAAKAALREKRTGPDTRYTVYFRGGDYLFTETAAFDADDSNALYAAWNGEKVRFIGGVKVDPAYISSASDSPIAERMLDQSKTKDLLVIDMSVLCENPQKLPDFWCQYKGHRNYEVTRGDIYIGNTGLTRARWPNGTFTGTDPEKNMSRVAVRNHDGDPDSDDKIAKQDSMSFFFGKDVTDHVKLWDESYINDVYIYGYFTNGYTHETVRPYELNTETGEMRLKTCRHPYDVSNTICHLYFLNVPEELDLPGESYVDYTNGKIYFLPTEDYDVNDIWYSTLKGTMINLDGTHDIGFTGIDFLYSRGVFISGTGTDTVTLDSCTFAYNDLFGVNIDGNRTVLRGCELHHTGLAAVLLSGGGDPITLESSGCVIENCVMHDTSRTLFNNEYWAEDTQFVKTSCVNTVIRHNVFYNCTMEAIRLKASNCIVEYNDIHDCNTECGDYGALYISANATVWGSQIRYNSFRDIGTDMQDYGSHCIYFDGAMAGDIYGNLFYNATGVTESQEGVIKFGEAQCGYIGDNIFVDCWDCIWNAQSVDPNSNWILSFAGRDKTKDSQFYDGLMSIGFDSEYYHACFDGTNTGRIYEYIDYEKLDFWRSLSTKEIMEKCRTGEIKMPTRTTIVENNIFLNYRLLIRQYGVDLRDNYTDQHKEDPSIFVDYEGKDFRLTEEGLAKVKEVIPDFTGVPFDEIGLQK